MQDKSDENWRVGLDCLQKQCFNAASSRIYYAVFQAVLLWARNKKGYNKNHGVHPDMIRYVRTEGKARHIYGRKLAELRSLRETADYQPDTPSAESLDALLSVSEQIRDYYLKKAQHEIH